MDELKKLMENAGVKEAVTGTTPHVTGANGSTYSVYLDDPTRVVIGKDGSSVAEAALSDGKVIDTSIQDPRAVLEALIAWSGTFKDEWNN